jgi:hypothetical protein
MLESVEQSHPYKNSPDNIDRLIDKGVFRADLRTIFLANV